MPITKSSGRQEVIVAMVDINFGDVATGVDAAAIQLPGNAIIVGGDVTVITPFNSLTTDVIDVGDSGSQNRYLNDANLAAAVRTALVPTGLKTAAQGDITVRWVGVGTAPSAGKVRLTVQYVVSTRADFSQG